MSGPTGSSISVVVATYQREQVLLDTIRAVTSLAGPLREVILVDQTDRHEPVTTDELIRLERESVLRRIRLETPSIPHAMNVGLEAAASEVVLFLDDDIIPDPHLIEAHAEAHQAEVVWAVAGQVLQPWQQPQDIHAPRRLSGLCKDFDFPFYSTRGGQVANVMAGNLSVKRKQTLAAGGFDENFAGVAYRFETEFARRLLREGGDIWFCPHASIRHLRVERGGTRYAGNHLTSASPRHGMGDYYFAMRQGWTSETVRYMLRRPLREVMTRFHMTHPWYIPVKLLGEMRAFLWACRLSREGPALIQQSPEDEILRASSQGSDCSQEVYQPE